jgi:signal transduction histidine kinase
MTKILVIEDETNLREDIITGLTFEGYEAVGAANGAEGVNLAFLEPPDLIVCDINMPGLNGYEVLLEIQSNSTTRLTPFIFLTAKASRDDLRMGMALGADDYLTKPFEIFDLYHAIKARLEKKAAQDAENQEQLIVFKDVLAHERRQRLFQAKLVDLFSNEFRSPLTSILSSNSLLRQFMDKMDVSRRGAHLDRIDASVRQLAQMMNGMLLIAQIESGKFNFQAEPVKLEHFLQNIVAEFEAIYGQTHHLRFESHFYETILSDPRLLRQIGGNLISNAIRYSPPASEIHIQLKGDQEQCILMVTDQGVGIPKDDLPHLFDEVQGGSTEGDVSGYGLNLAIVNQAVVEHGGSIAVESELGMGTTVIVRLPI